MQASRENKLQVVEIKAEIDEIEDFTSPSTSDNNSFNVNNSVKQKNIDYPNVLETPNNSLLEQFKADAFEYSKNVQNGSSNFNSFDQPEMMLFDHKPHVHTDNSEAPQVDDSNRLYEPEITSSFAEWPRCLARSSVFHEISQLPNTSTTRKRVSSLQNEDQQDSSPNSFFDSPTDIIHLAKSGRGRSKGSKNIPKTEERPKKPIQREKSKFTWVNMVTLALHNSPKETAVVQTVYQFIQHHFPSTAPTAEPGKTKTWKSIVRHTLTEKKGFIKREVTPGAKSSGNWLIDPARREELIEDCKAKAREFKHEVERLKMRHPDRLQDILNGKAGLPTNLENGENLVAQSTPWYQREPPNKAGPHIPIRQHQYTAQDRNQQFQQPLNLIYSNATTLPNLSFHQFLQQLLSKPE